MTYRIFSPCVFLLMAAVSFVKPNIELDLPASHVSFPIGLNLPYDYLALKKACQVTTGAPVPTSFLFGVINDQGNHFVDEWQRGIRVTTFEFQWQKYEPAEGVFDQTYIDHMRQMLHSLKTQGWSVQMIPGVQYAPSWVFANYPDVFYVNQYGDRYDPDPLTQSAFRVINAPFNPKARELIRDYLAQIFTDFNQSDPLEHFDSVRIGGGVQGELRYPPPVWNGHSNSYWAFDPSAQNPSDSGIPQAVIGWRPGIDKNPGSVDRGQLLINPDFEETDPLIPSYGWSPDDQVTASFSSTQFVSGQHSLQLYVHDSHRIHQYVRIDPNTNYSVGGWLKSASSTGYARIFFSQYDATFHPVNINSFVKFQNASSLWEQLSGQLTTTANTHFLKVEMDGSQPGTYYFDNLWVKPTESLGLPSRNVLIPHTFYDWYLQSLTNYQDWQINTIRQYYDGQLDIVYAGKGLREVQLTDALNNDLNGDGWSEKNSALYSASVYARHIASLPRDMGKIDIFVTGIDEPDASLVNDLAPFPMEWSAARWLSYLAKAYGFPIWGENSGKDNPDKLNLSVMRMRQNGFVGLMWGFESELYASTNQGAFASIDDYSKAIKNNRQRYLDFLPFCRR